MEKSIGNTESSSKENKIECKLYRRRWFMLAMFVAFSVSNSFQWLQYSIIANLVMKYYDVDSATVNWTSLIFMVTFVPLIFPASHFLDNRGLRWSLLLGSFGTAAGACVKTASVGRDLFWVTFIGQTTAAVSQVFMLTVPPSVSAAWFGENEVSTACSIGVFGNQFGVAMGFLLPPIFVQNSDNIEVIGSGLANLYYFSAGYASAIFILIVLFFQDRPPTPPSPQQALQKDNASENKEGFLNLLKRVRFNRNYILLIVLYAINQGVFNSLSTLLNQVILEYFENGQEFAGRIGLVFVISGMLAGVVFGIILDKTHKFKETTLVVFALSLLGMIAFTFTLQLQSQLIVYVTAIILGCFLGGYMPIAYDFGAELTYPEPEGMITGLLTMPNQISGTVLTLAYDPLLASAGAMWTNVTQCAFLLLGTLIHTVIQPDLRRQAVTANKSNSGEL